MTGDMPACINFSAKAVAPGMFTGDVNRLGIVMHTVGKRKCSGQAIFPMDTITDEYYTLVGENFVK